MRANHYNVRMSWGETWTLIFNGAQASAPIQYCDGEGEAQDTPFQTADACHSPFDAAGLVVEWWDGDGSGDYLGEDGHVEAVDEA